MARPAFHPYPQLTAETKRVESQSTRDAIFEPHKEIIRLLYVENRMPLKTLMERMRVDHGLTQTTKPWKTKLKAWGFKHHLTVKDAAYILRCLNQASSKGGQEAVLFSGRIRRREDIEKYIQRSKDISSEDDLLSRIGPQEPTPSYMQLVSLEQTPPLSSTPGSVFAQNSSAEISPLIKPISSPGGSSRTSEEIERLPDSQAGRPNPTQVTGNTQVLLAEGVLGLENESSGITAGQQAIVELARPFKLNRQEMHSPTTQHQVPENHSLSIDVTIAALSAQPIDLSKLGIIPPDNERFNLGFDSHAYGDYSNCPQVSEIHSHAARFVQDCLLWCYCAGQEDRRFQQHAEYHYGSARLHFVCMLQDTRSPGEECLAALSVMTTFFESLGHAEKLLRILTDCDRETRKYCGDNHPLTKTIAFKKNLVGCRESGNKPKHNLDELWEICEQMKRLYPNSRGPALTARYNHAWAMLEMQHHDLARRELQAITAESRSHFGPDHIQTIMCAATLARATLHCGDAETARKIIVCEVCPRVENTFHRNHPYTWEANHRQAYFLWMLANKANGRARDEYLWAAEELLREVVIERRRVLGDSNPKSAHSFGLLKKVLEEQCKFGDAQKLADWCEYKQTHRKTP